MSSSPYAVSLQSIREEAGLHHTKKGESPTGTVNGSNKQFVVARTFVVDRTYDDVLDADDVVFYVNGIPATVESVVSDSGLITMVTAPANGATVSVDYCYSVLSDVSVDNVRQEALAWLVSRVKSYIAYDDLTADDYPMIFNVALRMFAAGILLIRDYGSSADTDLTSKDGYKKIQTAKSMLDDWIVDISDDGSSTSPATGTMITDGNLFRRNTDLDGTMMEPYPDTDEFFHHDD